MQNAQLVTNSGRIVKLVSTLMFQRQQLFHPLPELTLRKKTFFKLLQFLKAETQNNSWDENAMKMHFH